MRTLPVIFAALGLLFSVSAMAAPTTSNSSSTLNDIANMQLTLEKAEYEKKLGELRRSAGGQERASPAVTTSSGSSISAAEPDVNPVLKGVYGLGKRLYAIVDMGGTEVEFSTGDTYFGYRALSINPLETVLVKLDSKGASKGGKVYRLRLTGAGDMSAVRNLPPLPSVPGMPVAAPEPERLSAPPRPARAAPAAPTPARPGAPASPSAPPSTKK
jgi:type IV pilus biogenesis protein PilP